MCLLRAIADLLPQLFAVPQYSYGSVEDLLDGCEPIGIEITPDLSFLRLWVVVTIEVEDPKGVEMRMHGHMQCVRVLSHPIISTIFIQASPVARITRLGCD